MRHGVAYGRLIGVVSVLLDDDESSSRLLILSIPFATPYNSSKESWIQLTLLGITIVGERH